MKKIIVCGNYGAKNIGDEMILAGILKMLGAVAPDADITVFSGAPADTSTFHKVHAVKQYPTGLRSAIKWLFNGGNDRKATKQALKDSDYFLLGGGGLFGGPERRGNSIWALQALKAYFQKKPVIMYGQSIGDLKSWFSKFIVKKLFGKAHFIAVRDNDSKKKLENLGIKKEIHLVPDMALRLEKELVEGAKEISTGASQIEKKVIVSLRQMKGIKPEFKKSVAQFLNWLIEEKGYKVVLANFQKGVGSDENLHKDLLKLINKKEHVSYIDEIKTIEELFALFASARLVLGMRLHSIITAMKIAAPFIAINYAPKVKAFIKDTGLDKYMLEMADVSLNALKEKFEEVEKNHPQIKELLKEYVQKSKNSHHKVELELLKSLYNKSK